MSRWWMTLRLFLLCNCAAAAGESGQDRVGVDARLDDRGLARWAVDAENDCT